jgi:predicted TIM-barrel fold metal-dependent hydrolase
MERRGPAVPDYPLFDADNHYYEPRDCFTRHIEPRLRPKAIRIELGDDGRDRIWVGEKPFTFLKDWSFERAYRPGALREMLRQKRYAAGDEGPIEAIRPEYQQRDARLACMDRQGLEACWLFPTLAVCVEHSMKDDPEQLVANFRAFNRWLDEDWGFAWRHRIYAVPLLSLVDLDAAVAELEWVLARGARVIGLRPGPAFGRNPGDPCFDPFWARVNEARAVVAFHIGESGYNELMSVHFGEQPNPSSHLQSALQWSCFYGDRPIMDTIAALVFSNLFGRHPHVRVASVENGSLWVPYLMRVMDKMGGMGRNGPWPGGRIGEKPSAIVRRHVFVSPYHEEDIPALAGEIGATQVLFGSDFPHAEGLAEPVDFAEAIATLPADAQRRILRDNARELVG